MFVLFLQRNAASSVMGDWLGSVFRIFGQESKDAEAVEGELETVDVILTPQEETVPGKQAEAERSCLAEVLSLELVAAEEDTLRRDRLEATNSEEIDSLVSQVRIVVLARIVILCSDGSHH